MSAGAIPALLGTVMFIIGILVVKYTILGLKKSVSTVKKITHNDNEELEKITELIQRISYSFYPKIGKVEQIQFYLALDDERYFYEIPPHYLPKVRKKLEQNINQIKSEEYYKQSYGFDYAIRQLWIGDELVLEWKNN